MAKTLNQLTPTQALIKAASDFHTRGWMRGTAGNLSIRDAKSNSNCFWITASGLPKGCLDDNDFLCIDTTTGERRLHQPDIAPSAETAIHQTIYVRFPAARCCMHVHSVDAALAVSRHAANTPLLPLPKLEMLKGFGIQDEDPNITLPIFENHADVSLIAQEISTYYETNDAQLSALMIRHHGITVWGQDPQETYNKVELMEFILSYLARL